MTLKCGIVGLPNVGKSTLFNALIGAASAQAANYPFCTIEPNTGIIAVPDERLDVLASIANSQKIIPTQLEFVDIAGLVKGASRGEGLGNKFLGHIREVDAIVYVLRCFDDNDIVHVSGSVDPISDASVIEIELAFADLDSLRGRLPAVEKKAKFDKSSQELVEIINKIISCLENGVSPRTLITPENFNIINGLQLLSTKPFFYVSNVSESDVIAGNDYTKRVDILAASKNVENVIISAQIESEIASISDKNEQMIFLQDMGLKSSGLDRIAKTAYKTLDLQTFFTIGPKEARAWTVKQNCFAPNAAGVIHSDFEKGFICAETISYNDYIAHNGELGAKNAGKMRVEGKTYQLCDGDVLHFRFNV